MAHLIQPIEIDAIKRCVKHGATTPKWRTVSIITSGALTGVEDDDSWEANDSTNPTQIQIKYATCCIWQATVRFTFIAAGTYDAQVTINGVSVAYSPSAARLAGSEQTFIIDLAAEGLMNRACGNVWDIRSSLSFSIGTLPSVSLEIVDVTFGPPV